MVSIARSVTAVATMFWVVSAGYAMVGDRWVRRHKRHPPCEGDACAKPNASLRQEPWVRRSKRRNGTNVAVKTEANGEIKQKVDMAGDALPKSPNDILRCQTRTGAVLKSIGDSDELDVDSYENVGSAQDCALLCHSNHKCKTYFYVKSPTNPLYKQCVLTKWTGQLAHLIENDCCDSGSPCSAVELADSLKSEIKMLKLRAAERAKDIAGNTRSYEDKLRGQQNEISKLNKDLGTRQDLVVSKDRENTKEKNKLTVEEKELNVLTVANKQYHDEIATKTQQNDGLEKENRKYRDEIATKNEEHHRIETENLILEQREEETSKREAAKATLYEDEIVDQRKQLKRLQHAVDIKQQIIAGKDVENAIESQTVARLTTEARRLSDEVEFLTAQIERQTSYVHGLSAALALSSILLLPIAGLLGWERYVQAQKPKQRHIFNES